MTLTSSPCPFTQWGIDIVGLFHQAKGQVKFLVMVIDYFTKRVEAEPLATITEERIRGFVWKNIICRFGLPRVIIPDNGRQFDNNRFKTYCSSLGISNHFFSLAHLQANGQVEVTNQTLVRVIKRRLDGKKGYGLRSYHLFYGSTERQ